MSEADFQRLRRDEAFDPASIADRAMISETNQTLLQQALAHRPEFAPDFIGGGVDLDHQDDNGQTALQYALARSQYDLANAIVDAGAVLNTEDKYGNGPLWTAVLNPKPDYALIRKIVAGGADPDKVNNAGRSPRDIANTKRDAEMLEALRAT